MLANVFITSTIVITVIVASAMSYKSYEDMQEIKSIQETYETIISVKQYIADHYNKKPSEVTRDEMIAHLPEGPNWEKIFLSNKYNSNSFSENALIDENGNFILSSDDKLKLLTLKSKLENVELNNISTDDTKEVYEVGGVEITRINDEEMILKNIKKIKVIIFINLRTIDLVSLETIISSNSSFDISIVKQKLKYDLQNSNNSFDVQIYNAIKGFLDV